MNPTVRHLLDETLHNIRSLPAEADPERIEETATLLEGMNYRPILLTDAPGFLRIERADLIDLLSAAANEPDAERATQAIRLLDHHYQLLCRLRRDEPEAWDEVNELMEDD